jgi:hypothetical protein
MDTDDFIKDFEQQLEWFCDRIMEPVPIHPKDKEKVFNRMVETGWIRKSEVEIYEELTKPDD